MSLAPRITLNDKEELVEVIRRHWLQAAIVLSGIFLLFLIPFFFLWPLFHFGLPGLLLFLLILGLAVVLGVREFYRWYRSAVVLTTHRLMLIEQRGLFDRGVTELPFPKVSEAHYRIKGFWQTVGGYGTISINAHGVTEPLDLVFMPAPERVHRLITELREEGSDSETIGENAWWWDRFQGMSHEEQQQFLTRIQGEVGQDDWRDLFRPQKEKNDVDVEE